MPHKTPRHVSGQKTYSHRPRAQESGYPLTHTHTYTHGQAGEHPLAVAVDTRAGRRTSARRITLPPHAGLQEEGKAERESGREGE